MSFVRTPSLCSAWAGLPLSGHRLRGWSHQEAQCHTAHYGWARPELRFPDSSSGPAPSFWSLTAPSTYQLLFSLDSKPSEGTDRIFLGDQLPHQLAWPLGGAISEKHLSLCQWDRLGFWKSTCQGLWDFAQAPLSLVCDSGQPRDGHFGQFGILPPGVILTTKCGTT